MTRTGSPGQGRAVGNRSAASPWRRPSSDMQRNRAGYATFRRFRDQAFYPCLEATIGRPYALYVHGGSDTTGAVRNVETIATGLKWKRLHEPVTVLGTPDAKDREACWELGPRWPQA